MIAYCALPMTFDTIRCIFGPLPLPFCTLAHFTKQMIFLNVSQITMILTCTKFAYIFIFKSIPTIEDNLVSVFIYIMVNIMSFLAVFSRMMLLKRPLVHQVNQLALFILICFYLSMFSTQLICTGHNYNDWVSEEPAIKSILYFCVFCLTCHYTLSICITIAKYKIWINENEVLQLNNQNQVNYGKLTNSGIFLGLLGGCLYHVVKLKNTPPSALVENANIYNVFLTYSGLPTFVGLITAMLFYAKSKALRRHLKSMLCKDNNVYPINE